jgi:hypothetical protein
MLWFFTLLAFSSKHHAYIELLGGVPGFRHTTVFGVFSTTIPFAVEISRLKKESTSPLNSRACKYWIRIIYLWSIQTMKKVTLLFSSTADLWEFAQSINSAFLQIKLEQKIVICTCSDIDVEKAVDKYGAKVLGI